MQEQTTENRVSEDCMGSGQRSQVALGLQASLALSTGKSAISHAILKQGLGKEKILSPN